MALINKLNDIGDAIREKTDTTDLLTLDAMPAAIRSISGGGEVVFPDFEIKHKLRPSFFAKSVVRTTICMLLLLE